MDDSSPPTPELPERKNRFSSISGIKRNKVSRACDECRKRKVRCDGAQPCARCQKSSTECIFSNVTPKRGPPKEYLESFEARLRTIDIVLQVLESTSQNDVKLTENYNYTTWERKNPIIETNTQLDTSSIGHALYIPDFPARLDRIESLYKNNLLNTVQTTPEQAPTITTQQKNEPMKTNLIQLYFQYVHPSIPFLHRSILSKSEKESPSLLLLNAIYAVSSRFTKYDKRFKQQEEDQDNPPGWSYYKMALSLIDLYADRPRLSTIQALLLMAKYNEHVYKSGFFWRTKHFIQLAVKMSTDMGLTKEEPFSACNYNSEMKRRTFWAVYTYEVLMSTEQGLQLHFKHKECTVKYPHVLSDESSMDSSAVLNYYWITKVIHTQAAVLEFMRTKYGAADNTTMNEQEEQHKFSMLEQSLTNLGRSIPPMTEEKGSMQTSFIHLIYHLTTILLYRPYALNDGQHSRHISPCLSSAATITQIVDYGLKLEAMDAFYGVMRGHQQIIYCLTAAVTIQRALQHLSDQTNEMYQRTCSLLQAFIKYSPAVAELESNNTTTTETPDVSHRQLQVVVESSRPDLQIMSPSNTSSTRSSPLIPALNSPHSPSLPAPTIRKRHSRSSLQFTTTDSMNYVMQSSSSYVPTEHTTHHRLRPTAVNRSPYANNRLSAPALGSLYQQSPYFYQMQQHQQQQQQQQVQQQQQAQQLQQQQQQHHQHMYSYSQPSSPTTSQFGNDYIGSNNSVSSHTGGGAGGFPSAPRRTTSMSRNKTLRRSASSTGEFIVPSQQQQRTNRTTPYINPRRHTLTNTTPPDLSTMMMMTQQQQQQQTAIGPPSSTTSSTNSSSSSMIVPPSPRQQHLHAMAAAASIRQQQRRQQNRFSAPVMMMNNNTGTSYMIPITQQQQQQYQTNMMLDPSFPMDPVIPDSPNESMMGLLLNPWDFSQQQQQHRHTPPHPHPPQP